jgi:hypothetical protein
VPFRVILVINRLFRLIRVISVIRITAVGYTGACKLKSDHTVGYTGVNVQMVCFKQNSIQR